MKKVKLSERCPQVVDIIADSINESHSFRPTRTLRHEIEEVQIYVRIFLACSSEVVGFGGLSFYWNQAIRRRKPYLPLSFFEESQRSENSFPYIVGVNEGDFGQF